jgi:hypothetical protein
MSSKVSNHPTNFTVDAAELRNAHAASRTGPARVAVASIGLDACAVVATFLADS